MGFVFRTVFWLGLALIILPPEARIARDGATDIRDLDIGLEVHNAVYGLWAYTTHLAKPCEHNPGLCKAGIDLLDKTVHAATELTKDAQESWQTAELEADEPKPKKAKKIQARVE